MQTLYQWALGLPLSKNTTAAHQAAACVAMGLLTSPRCRSTMGKHSSQSPQTSSPCSRRSFWGELLVLQQLDGFGADAFEQVDAPVDGAQVDVEGPSQACYAT